MPEWCLLLIYTPPQAQTHIALAPMVCFIATSAVCDGDEAD